MPKLRCSASKCLYNQTHFCVRNRIHVQGVQAIEENETQCGTFKLNANNDLDSFKTEFAYLNEANEHLSINCDCEKCKYNDNELCQKDVVRISGSSAENRQDTACESFEKKLY